MATITYGMLLSIDGYIADEDGVITLPVPGPELHEHFNETMRRATASIYGRRMWEMMRYWGEPDPARDAVADAFAAAWTATPKIVVSTTLKGLPDGVRLVREDVVATVRALKAELPGEIDVSGADLAATLGTAGLIDEYRLYTQPVVLGAGTPYFADGFRPALRLLGTEILPEGVVLTRYAPADASAPDPQD